MIAVDIATQPTFSTGTPRRLFEGSHQPSAATRANYDVTPDGQRFLMVMESEEQQAKTQINVVRNWFAELKQRVPTSEPRLP